MGISWEYNGNIDIWIYLICYNMDIWLVVSNMAFIFPYIGNVIIPSDFHIFQRGWNHQPQTIEMDDNWGVYTLMDWTPVLIINENLFAGDYLWFASQSELDMNADILKMDSVWFSNVISSPTSSSGFIPRNSNMAIENPQLFDDCAMNLQLKSSIGLPIVTLPQGAPILPEFEMVYGNGRVQPQPIGWWSRKLRAAVYSTFSSSIPNMNVLRLLWNDFPTSQFCFYIILNSNKMSPKMIQNEIMNIMSIS